MNIDSGVDARGGNPEQKSARDIKGGRGRKRKPEGDSDIAEKERSVVDDKKDKKKATADVKGVQGVKPKEAESPKPDAKKVKKVEEGEPSLENKTKKQREKDRRWTAQATLGLIQLRLAPAWEKEFRAIRGNCIKMGNAWTQFTRVFNESLAAQHKAEHGDDVVVETYPEKAVRDKFNSLSRKYDEEVRRARDSGATTVKWPYFLAIRKAKESLQALDPQNGDSEEVHVVAASVPLPPPPPIIDTEMSNEDRANLEAVQQDIKLLKAEMKSVTSLVKELVEHVKK